MLFKQTPDICKHAAKVYFRPFRAYKELEDMVVAPAQNNYEKRLHTLKKVCCFNQGAIAQYFYIASEYHKDLKEYVNGENVQTFKVERLMDRLIDYLNHKFEEYTLKNFNLLEEYFEGRDNVSPRFCLKGNFKEDRTGDSVITVFRNKKVSYISDCAIQKNTGFYHIKTTGRHFLCNDIPKAAAEGKYHNPRLLNKKSIDFCASRDKSIFLKVIESKKKRLNWAECWEDYGKNTDTSSFYKSTLIVPLTLLNNVLDDDFTLRMPNADRLIFGFLCMDHVKEDYFEESDVSAGYVFADLMSIYLFTRRLFTEISKTYNDVDKKLSAHLVESQIKKMGKVIANYTDIYETKSQRADASSYNHLYDLDECLLHYIKK
ncbi:hypothetical protein KP004_20085 [Geomonas oryzisoli]|uniref:Transposase n=1 Tax=Geomonas oryzisoli TaxID=2847992 RepID=A0ABX8J9Q3_9BACT|nr:hypothetical protein [Geomonas oryzisoli]QWV93432.1 hypothetical protein KP004_20085 [Geomonas oryzisoli]